MPNGVPPRCGPPRTGPRPPVPDGPWWQTSAGNAFDAVLPLAIVGVGASGGRNSERMRLANRLVRVATSVVAMATGGWTPARGEPAPPGGQGWPVATGRVGGPHPRPG